MEIWKKLEEIPSYEWLKNYEISSYGNIKSFKYEKLNGKLLKTRKRKGNGLTYIVIGINNPTTGKRHTLSLHRLVLLAFNYIPNHKQMTVDHIDENTFNNKLENLQWLTVQENIIKSQAYSQKFDDADIIAKEYLEDPAIKLQDLATKYSCSIATIWFAINKYSSLCNNKRRKIFSNALRKEIAEYYLNKHTLQETGIKYNCCSSQVSFIVKQYKRGDLNEIS